MPGTATVTGKTGPDKTLTARVFQNVSRFTVNTNTEVLELDYDDGALGPKRIEIDISAATTFTVVISGSTYTVTVS